MSKTIDRKHDQARDTKTPAARLQELALDTNLHTRFLVARNRATPIRVLWSLTDDKSGQVCVAADQNIRWRLRPTAK